jgi:hypothetical protein
VQTAEQHVHVPATQARLPALSRCGHNRCLSWVEETLRHVHHRAHLAFGPKQNRLLMV